METEQISMLQAKIQVLATIPSQLRQTVEVSRKNKGS